MSSFSINISDTLNTVSHSKTTVENYKQTLNTYINSTLNFDSAWNDANTPIFMDFVKKEQIDFNDQIYLLTLNLSAIENFCQHLKNFSRTSFGLDLASMEYASEKIDVLISYLNECYNILNQNYYIFRNLGASQAFKYYSTLEKYKSETLTYRNNVYNLKNKLNTFKYAVEELIYNAKVKINEIDIKTVSDTILDHTYQISSNNLIKTDVKLEK